MFSNMLHLAGLQKDSEKPKHMLLDIYP